jgi:hypothetical protein
MDPVSDLIRSWKIPVGKWGKSLIDFIVAYFQWLFDALKISLNFVVEGDDGGPAHAAARAARGADRRSSPIGCRNPGSWRWACWWGSSSS